MIDIVSQQKSLFSAMSLFSDLLSSRQMDLELKLPISVPSLLSLLAGEARLETDDLIG